MAQARPVKPSGVMPMTVNDRPLSVIAWPTIAGLPPKRRCQ
jgi:hypothetical protein